MTMQAFVLRCADNGEEFLWKGVRFDEGSSFSASNLTTTCGVCGGEHRYDLPDDAVRVEAVS